MFLRLLSSFEKIELELELLHGGRVERNDGVVIVDCFINEKTEKTRLDEKTRPRREKRKNRIDALLTRVSKTNFKIGYKNPYSRIGNLIFN